MAGLLAWAADVVSGNGTAFPQHEEQQRPSFRFSPQQQDYVRQLDAEANALQQIIQQLRQRIPPPDISRSLPHLHADSLASHAALTMELNAHQATKKEAHIREATLQEENAAYSKAITSLQQHVQEKAQEREQLKAKLQEMEEEEASLRSELDHLEIVHAEKISASQSGQEKVEKIDGRTMSSGDKVLMEGEELQRTRTELMLWEGKLSALEQEWATLLQNSARWPSAAQREKELERRLRNLSEQLVAKQAQAETLTNERNAIELQLNQVNETRRKLLLGDADLDVKRYKIGRFGTAINSSAEESKIHSQSTIAALWKRASRGIFENFSSIESLSDIWSRETGIQLRKVIMLRALIMAYIFALHVIVFVIISFAS